MRTKISTMPGLPIDQLPKTIFAAVLLLEGFDELPVRREGSVIVYNGIAGLAFGKVARGVAVAL